MRAVRARRPGWRSRRSRCWSCSWSRIDHRAGGLVGGAAACMESQDAAPVFGFEMFVRCFRRRAARRRCWSWSRRLESDPKSHRIPCGTGQLRGQPAALEPPGPVRRRTESRVDRGNEGTVAGASLASPGLLGPCSPGADANFLLLAPPSGLSLRDFCTIRPEKHRRVGAIAGDVRSPAQDQGPAISAAAHRSEAPGAAPKRYILLPLV